MENATKALLMGGAILIAVIIISLGVALFMQMSNTVNNETNKMTQQEIDQFNSKIIPYLGETISGSQVNALIQYIFSLNNNDQTYNVSITFPVGDEGSMTTSTLEGTTFSNGKKVKTGVFYGVTASYSGSGLINSITVTK